MIEWLDEFYGSSDTRAALVTAFGPLFRRYANDVWEAEGQSGTPPKPFVEGLIDGYVTHHLESSRAQLSEVVAGDKPFDGLAARLDEWAEKRPAKVADNETVRTSNAIALEAMRSIGAKEKVWVTSGTCAFCKEMAGKRAALNEPFISAGDEVNPEGAEPMQVRSNVGHPPLHQGCRCSIEPDMQLGLPGFDAPDIPLIGAHQFASEAEALAWAEQNLPDVLKLPSAVRNKLQGYSGQGFGPTNRTLRGQSRDYLRGNPAEPDLVGKELAEAVAEEAAISKRLTAALDEVMAPLPDNITVYRALKENVLVDGFKLPSEDLAGLRSLVGQTFEDKGFLSTSLGGVADTYQSLPVQMHITVAQGTKATYLRPLSYYQNENELLLARGTRFTITSAREESGHWVVEAVVLPT